MCPAICLRVVIIIACAVVLGTDTRSFGVCVMNVLFIIIIMIISLCRSLWPGRVFLTRR